MSLPNENNKEISDTELRIKALELVIRDLVQKHEAAKIEIIMLSSDPRIKNLQNEYGNGSSQKLQNYINSLGVYCDIL